MAKIEHKTSDNVVTFGNIKPGEVFLYNEKPFIRLEPGLIGPQDSINAVHLTGADSGHVTRFNNERPVVQLSSCELKTTV